MFSLTDILGTCRKHPAWPSALAASKNAPAALGQAIGAEIWPQIASEAQNIGALFSLWHHRTPRVIWRADPEAARRVATTGLGFIPPVPPQGWGGDAVIIEGQPGAPLLDGVFSLGCYFMRPVSDPKAPARYWLVALDTAGAFWAESLPSRAGGADEALKAMESPDFASIDTSTPDFAELRLSPERKKLVLKCLQFCLAWGYYAGQSGPGWEIKADGPGPPMRQATKKGKTRIVRVDGQPATQWEYQSLRFDAEPGPGSGGSLDKDGLRLAPVMVRAYWRWDPRASRPIFVDTHASQRWRRG